MDAIEDLHARTAGMMDAGEAALRQAGQLAVTYSFSMVGAIILLIAGYVIAGMVERSVYAGLGRFRGFDETLRKFFSRTARYALMVLVGVTVLAQFGVQTASIIAALGAIGLAIGLALQGTLQNIAAGIMLLALRPFRVGEYIDAGGVAGTVQEIGLFATELKMGDGLYVLAPNSQLWNTPVTNYSRNPQRMNDIALLLGHDSDATRALGVMKSVVEADDRVLPTPAPDAFLADVTDAGLTVTARYWTTTSNWWRTKLDLTAAIKQALEENGIRLAPRPQEVRWLGTPEQAGEQARV